MPSREFEVLDSPAEVCGYMFHAYGEDVLRQALDVSREKGVLNKRENLEEIAAELAEAGMVRASEIVLEYAAQSPSEADLCPYEPGTTNYRAWHQSLRRRQGRRKDRRHS